VGGSQAIPGSTSAPTARVIDVIELLAKPDKQRLRYTDVVRELALTQATAHAILTTLCDRGWLTRDPVDKTFSLGPALALAAERADSARPIVHVAREAAQQALGQLAAQSGYAASVVERVGESMIITAYEGGDVRQRPGTGDRIPYAPPFGVAFAAWDTQQGQREWIQRAAGCSAPLVRRLEQVLARTRERGFDVDWTTPALAQAAELVGTLQRDGMPAHVQQIMDQLVVEYATIGFMSDDDAARRAQPVATMAAPVFDHLDRVVLIVCVHPLRALTLRQINAIGRRLTRAAAAVSTRSARCARSASLRI
jgi:DNA-binding IclR family transcriptional regulator